MIDQATHVAESIDRIEDLESAIAKAEAEALALKARREVVNAAARPNALATVLALIAKHGLTRAELDPAMRKRAFVPKPRKAKASAPAPQPMMRDGTPADPAKFGVVVGEARVPKVAAA